ncbi:MAG: hypothetical protein UW86_C0002G0041 [Microgenomates group bacterium GW2011_GWA1_Microgenomates_45_10]|nr:MAG: hypothetical protein UW69_C0016G0011 [Microgenomates group bacterium GW2011_GWA2_44_7]KKT78100.1 MAG: hypothetical protein UW73_C0007G0041 [Microgenomates group bacterium GW2011_GWB1_44_8]KKT87437.1 MAG: hypothetical protein UW86_C0002G0041 [Microgenomates group bacterium GW2011_GWA1_Microgenomates_45_10]
MITEDVVNYIREAKARGRSVDEIKASLLGAGWKEEDVTEAMIKSGVIEPPPPQIPIPPAAPTPTSTDQTIKTPSVASSEENTTPSQNTGLPPDQPTVPAEEAKDTNMPVQTPVSEATSWGTVGSGATASEDTITLPEVDTGGITPQVSMKEVAQSASVMSSVQPLDAGVQPANTAKLIKRRYHLSRRTLLMLVFGVVLVVGVILSLAVYKILSNPLNIVTNALSKTLLADSFSVGVALPQNSQLGNFSGTVSYLKGAGKLSKAELRLEAIGGDTEKTLTINTVFGGDEVFFKPNYSQLTQLETWLKSIYPKLEDLRTYQTAQPVLKGDSWFYAKLPKGEMSSESAKRLLGVDPNKETIVKEKLVKSLIIRKSDTVNIENGSFYRVVLGFDKAGLKDLLATLDANNQPSSIGQLGQIVEAVSNWDADIVEILVDKKSGYLASVTFALPEASKQVISSKLSGVNVLGFPATALISTFSDRSTEQVWKLSFSNFGSVVSEVRPVGVIDFDNAMEIVKVELPPILGGILNNSRLLEPFEINIAEVEKLWQSGDYRGGLTQAGNMIGIAKTDKEKSLVHYWIGATSYKLEDLTTAEKEELLAASLDPKSGIPYAILALIEIEKSDYQKAYGYATKGVALETASAWTHNSLGLALLGINKRAEAVKEFRKALILASGSAEIQSNLDAALASPTAILNLNNPEQTPRPSPTPTAKTATSSPKPAEATEATGAALPEP